MNESKVRLVAHVCRGVDGRSLVCEPLIDHLKQTSDWSMRFGSEFGMGETAALLGRCHDFGKASDEFQQYIRMQYGREEEDDCESDSSEPVPARRKGPDHSTAGARWLVTSSGVHPLLGGLFAYIVAGHHSGLPDGMSDCPGRLDHRIRNKAICEWEANLHADSPAALSKADVDAILSEFSRMPLHDALAIAGRMRMLYSALVDADFLATESFMDGVKHGIRQCFDVAFDQLQDKLDKYIDGFQLGRVPSPVDGVRREIRDACLAAAGLAPGLFTLEVPTGGGKTLSSMAFAIKHARLHGLRRIVYVIPYTSIIEQNAEVFRRVFGEDVVLEHHSNRDPDKVGERAKLLTENWDAPIVVTTNVQFFESLYANRSSRCRKLHNLAKSVIVLDEAQSLPTPFLRPCLHALDELMSNAGASVVVCTATLPSFFRGDFGGSVCEERWNGLAGNDAGRRDIVAGLNLEARLTRVSAERIVGSISDEDLASRLAAEHAVLAIVSTRRHARRLYEQVRDQTDSGTAFHLSAQMCPAHRLEVLERVKGRLKRGESCRLVTTQLVEAGVDIDFPCVYREIAGCDSMVQAAGRCNREGRLDRGLVVLFESAEKNSIPHGDLSHAADKGREVVSLPEFSGAMLSVAAVRKYFRLRYNDLDEANDLDAQGVFGLFHVHGDDPYGLQFKTCAERFKLIPEHGVTVYVPYDTAGRELCEAFRKAYAIGEQKAILRRLGRYAVSIHGQEPRDADGNLYAEKVHDLVWVMTSPEVNYSQEYGLSAEAANDFLNV